MAKDCKRVVLWSGPRNVSTALMYSFAQRSDTRVFDEPLYGHYLRVSGAAHPMAAEIMAAMDCDGPRVFRELILGPCDRPIFFVKNMAHHLVNIEPSLLEKTINVFLIRDPREMLPSLARVLPNPVMADTGMSVQLELFRQLCENGEAPAVLDARELLLDPKAVLKILCERLRIKFDEKMLTWKAGKRAEDGVWGDIWYENLHQSTGFVSYRKKSEPVPDSLKELLAKCVPIYQALLENAIRA